MSPAARIVAILLACLACAGVGCRLGLKIKQGEWDASTVAGKDAQDKALKAAAQALQAMAPAQAKIIERVTHATVEKTVYRDCVNDPGVMRDINAAITNAEPASDQPMPAASATQ